MSEPIKEDYFRAAMEYMIAELFMNVEIIEGGAKVSVDFAAIISKDMAEKQRDLREAR